MKKNIGRIISLLLTAMLAAGTVFTVSFAGEENRADQGLAAEAVSEISTLTDDEFIEEISADEHSEAEDEAAGEQTGGEAAADGVIEDLTSEVQTEAAAEESEEDAAAKEIPAEDCTSAEDVSEEPAEEETSEEAETEETASEENAEEETAELSADETSGTCGQDLTWSFDVENNTLTITGSGAMYDYASAEEVPWAGLPVSEVILNEGITYIGTHAFDLPGYIYISVLPLSLSQIGAYAFNSNVSGSLAAGNTFTYAGSRLQWMDVVISEGNEAFSGKWAIYFNDKSSGSYGLFNNQSYEIYDESGKAICFVNSDGTGQTWEYSYDSEGRLEAVFGTRYLMSDSGEIYEAPYYIGYVYDKDGNVTETFDETQNFDGLGNILVVRIQDVFNVNGDKIGQQTTETMLDSEYNGIWIKTESITEEDGFATITRSEAGPDGTPVNVHQEMYEGTQLISTYDLEDGLHYFTNYVYDYSYPDPRLDKKLVQVYGEDDVIIRTEEIISKYDENGDITAILTNYEFFENGVKTGTAKETAVPTDTGTRARYDEFDAAGHLLSETDTCYDAAGNKVEQVVYKYHYEDGKAVTFDQNRYYVTLDNMAYSSETHCVYGDPNTYTYTYSNYDAEGNLTGTVISDYYGVGSWSYVFYDADGVKTGSQIREYSQIENEKGGVYDVNVTVNYDQYGNQIDRTVDKSFFSEYTGFTTETEYYDSADNFTGKVIIMRHYLESGVVYVITETYAADGTLIDRISEESHWDNDPETQESQYITEVLNYVGEKIGYKVRVENKLSDFENKSEGFTYDMKGRMIEHWTSTSVVTGKGSGMDTGIDEISGQLVVLEKFRYDNEDNVIFHSTETVHRTLNEMTLSYKKVIDIGCEHLNTKDGICMDCGKPQDGFANKGGVWGWYENGELQTEMTGIVYGTIDSKTNWYYIENGVLSRRTGITVKADGSSTSWYYVNNGEYDKNTVTIAERLDGVYPGRMFYVKGGKYVKVNEVVNFDGNKWGYFLKGVLDTDITGIVECTIDGKTAGYYFSSGIYTRASGLTRMVFGTDKTWYYVKDGILTKATGIAQKADGSDSTWYFVYNGVYKKATGIAQKADGSGTKWYYVQNGVYTEATGIAQKADGSSTKWYYVQNGVYTKATGIAQKADGSSTKWYYVEAGAYTKATGIAQ
ncbi:MAG: hypothetical protein HUJ76_07745, partial [Parasporobacterium sp.]|nr:hypothetical protein [Parasporobacterium sp.]